MKKTLVAIPCMDTVPAQFAQSLAMLQKKGEVAVSFQIGSLIYTSRNNLAKRAIQYGADYVLWLDSDMIFEPTTLTDMLDILEKNNLDILTGVYYRRVPPFTPVLLKTLEIAEDGKCEHANLEELPSADLFEVAGCGFGAVLMKTEIFIDVMAKFGYMFDPLGGVGEDLSFCWRARQCGYKIMATTALDWGHWGHNVITREFYEQYQRAKTLK